MLQETNISNRGWYPSVTPDDTAHSYDRPVWNTGHGLQDMSEIHPVASMNGTTIVMPGTPDYKTTERTHIQRDPNVKNRAILSVMALCCLGGLAGVVMVISWGVKGSEHDFTCDAACQYNNKSLESICTGEGCCAEKIIDGNTYTETCTDRSQKLLIVGIILIVLLFLTFLCTVLRYSIPSHLNNDPRPNNTKFEGAFQQNPLKKLEDNTAHPITSSLQLYVIKGDQKGVLTGSYLLKEGCTSWDLPVWETEDRRILSATASGCWSIMRNGDVIAQSVEHHTRMPHEVVGPMTWQVLNDGNWEPIKLLNITEAYPVGSNLEARLDDVTVTPARWVDCTVINQFTDGYDIHVHETEIFNRAEGLSGKVLEKVKGDILRRRTHPIGHAIRTPSKTEPKFEAKTISVKHPQGGGAEVKLTVVSGADEGLLLHSVVESLKLPHANYSLMQEDGSRATARLCYSDVTDGVVYMLVKDTPPISTPQPTRLEMSEAEEYGHEEPVEVVVPEPPSRKPLQKPVFSSEAPAVQEDDRSSVSTSVRREDVLSLQERIKQFSKRAGTPVRQRE